MEYATRDQAQQAVAQLSNQNLMGRLVYVREVGGTEFRSGGLDIKVRLRIVRRNLDLLVPRVVTVADLEAASAEAAVMAACPRSTQATAAVPPAAPLAAALADKSTWPM